MSQRGASAPPRWPPRWCPSRRGPAWRSRPSRVDALEAGDHRHLAESMAVARFRAGLSSMRALPCASSVMIGICQPSQERALQADVAKRHGQQARRHLLAGGDHRVVFVVGGGQALGRRARRRRSRPPARWSCRPWPRPRRPPACPRATSASTSRATLADALQVGHRGAAEFHHQPRHAWRPPLDLRCRLAAAGCRPPRKAAF